jgi:hypothetical protein
MLSLKPGVSMNQNPSKNFSREAVQADQTTRLQVPFTTAKILTILTHMQGV